MANPGSKRRKIHVSKNKKKSWNKYSDIKDIDDFLEEQRLQERTGASSNRASEELFFVETEVEEKPKEICSKKDKKNKPLRCFQSLTAYSKVPVPVPENCGFIGKKQKKCMSKALEKKLNSIQFQKQPSPKKGKEFLASRPFSVLWTEDKKDNEKNEFEEIVEKKQPKVPRHRYQKPSLLPSIEIPHPGASYNPTHEDHQKLLLEAILVEEKKEKEERHLKRVLDDMFPKKDDAPTHETWLHEMSQGLFEEDSEDAMDNHDDGLLEVGNPPVRAEDRKPKSKKRKRKMIQIEERERQLAKVEKKRVHDVYRLRSIKASLKEQEMKSKENQAEKDQREMERMYKPHVISRYKYEPHDLEVNLTEDLPKSLRSLKVEGSILEDRYKSLQRRNIIEPRVKQRRKRKYKLKIQVKRSHRDFK